MLPSPAVERRLGAVRAALVEVVTAGSSSIPPFDSPGVRRAWPGFKLHEQQAYVFIDGADVIETLDGCYQGVSEAQKLPVGNLLRVGDTPYERVGGWYIGSYINVLWDEQESLFKIRLPRGARRCGTHLWVLPEASPFWTRPRAPPTPRRCGRHRAAPSFTTLREEGKWFRASAPSSLICSVGNWVARSPFNVVN